MLLGLLLLFCGFNVNIIPVPYTFREWQCENKYCQLPYWRYVNNFDIDSVVVGSDPWFGCVVIGSDPWFFVWLGEVIPDLVVWLLEVIPDLVVWLLEVILGLVVWLLPVIPDLVVWLLPMIPGLVVWLLPVIPGLVVWLLPVIPDLAVWFLPTISGLAVWLLQTFLVWLYCYWQWSLVWLCGYYQCSLVWLCGYWQWFLVWLSGWLVIVAQSPSAGGNDTQNDSTLPISATTISNWVVVCFTPPWLYYLCWRCLLRYSALDSLSLHHRNYTHSLCRKIYARKSVCFITRRLSTSCKRTKIYLHNWISLWCAWIVQRYYCYYYQIKIMYAVLFQTR